MEIRNNTLGVFSLNAPAKMNSIILESVKVVTSRAEAMAKLALHRARQH